MLKKPLLWFKKNPSNLRQPQSFDKTSLRLLGESMMYDGQIQPVGAKPDGTLLWGERRYQAAQLVGLDSLNVVVIEKPLSDSESRVLQATENIHRVDLSDTEVYLNVKDLAALNPTWLKKDLAAHLHKDASWVTRVLAIDELIPAAREAFLGGAFGLSVAYEISKASAEEQHELLAAKLSGASRDEIGRQGRKQRKGTPAVRVSRIKCPLPSGAVVQVSGQAISLDDMIEAIVELLKEAKKAAEQGLDAKTFERVCKDKAKVKP
jgi:ParB/RepB/Spo0J family partition protein